MLKFFFKNITRFLMAGLLAFCLWLIVHRGGHKNQAPFWKDLSLTLWLPVQQSVSWLLNFPETTLNAVRELGHLRQELDRLQLDNQSLRLELSNHKSLEKDLARLQEVLQIKAKLPRRAKIARIVARDPSTWNKSFVVDAGAEEGVLMDSPVISEQGIVGRVISVTARNARVLLTSDANSSVAGIDDRSRVNGIVQGTGRNQLKFGYVSASEDIQKDDIIVSSGMGGIFPKGYPVGTVVKKVPSENGLTLDVELAAAVDYAALDYVFILPPNDLDQP